MGVVSSYKLEKLKIKAYPTESRGGKYEEISVMFNPSSFSLNFSNKYAKRPSLGGKDTNQYAFTKQGTLQLELIVDGTGVTDLGLSNLFGFGSDSVSKQIEDLIKHCIKMDGDKHEPKYLRVQWGSDLNLDCRLESLDITYNLFDGGGNPIRAKLNTTFIEDQPYEKIEREQKKSSPDVTHVRQAKTEDTLAQMTKDMYGSYDRLDWLARENDLDHFRRLEPGKKIVFPPLK